MGLPESISSWNLIYLSLGFLWKISLIVFRVWPFLWCWLSFIYSAMLVILVVVSIHTIVCLFRVDIIKDLKRTCRFHVKSYGWRHLAGYCVVCILIVLRCRNIAWYLLILHFDPSESLLDRTWLDCPLICIKYLCFTRIYIGGWLFLEWC